MNRRAHLKCIIKYSFDVWNSEGSVEPKTKPNKSRFKRR